MNESFTCPVCQATVPAGARACPECGADEHTGWNEQAAYAHVLDEDPAVTGNAVDDTGVTFSNWLRRNAQAIGICLAALLLFPSTLIYFPSSMLWVAVAFVAVVAIIYVPKWMANREPSGTGTRDSSARGGRAAQRLFDDLVRQARGDRALAQRLVDYEQPRNPHQTPAQHDRKAIERQEHQRPR